MKNGTLGLVIAGCRVSSVGNFCWKGLKGGVLPSIKEGV